MSAIEGIRPEITPFSRGRFSRFILRVLGSAGLMFSPLIVACSQDAKAVSPTLTSEQPIPTAIAVGIGSVFVPTGNEEIDNIQKRLMDPTTKGQVPEEDILKFNEAIGKRAEGTATAEAQKPATPDVKKESVSGILSPESEASGVYVQWKLPSGRMATGMGFRLKAGDELRIREDLQVAGGDSPLYNGYSIKGVSKEGRSFTYLGDITLAANISDIGKDLPAGRVVGKIAGSGATVFQDADINFLLVYPTEQELKDTFKDQTKDLPRTETLRPANTQPAAGGGFTFYDIQPPQPR